MSTPPSPALPQQRPRPTEKGILAQWQRYYGDPLLSLEGLRREAAEGELEEKRGLRSLGWRFFFSLLPSPSPTNPSSASSTYSTYTLLLSHSRSHYTSLRERYLRSPDGGWVKDGPSSSSSASDELGSSTGSSGEGKGKGGKAPLEKVDVKHNNPLGLEEENPWQAWFADLELRKTIRQDVQRTFPEVDYFPLPATQDRLTDLLFIWCKLHPSIGYRQGMHELLAPLLWVVDYDSLPSSAEEEETSLPHLVLAREWVEHDTWALFAALMKSAQVYYDHQPSVALSPKPQSAYPPTASSSTSSASLSSSSALVQPIVSIASHLQSLLSTLDPTLHSAFTSHQVEPQLYLIRWLRLLFSREFPLPDTLTLWDGLFARDPSLQLTTHIALAMLLRIRDALVAAAKEGYGEFLHVLLRYPPCSDGSFRPQLLLKQALYLRDNLSRSGAEYVRAQNASLGASVGEPQPDDDLGSGFSTPASRRGSAFVQHRRAASAAPGAGAGAGQAQGLGLFGKGLVGDLAKGVYGRAEALGINKAVMGAFNDIKRDFAEAQAEIAEQRRLRAAGMSQIPPYPSWDAPSSTPPPPPNSKDALSDLAKMRASSIAMSAAIDLCVAVLEKDLVPPTPDLGKRLDGKGEEEEEEEHGSGGGTKPGDIPLSRSGKNGGAQEGGKTGEARARQQNGQQGGKKPTPHLAGQTMALTALKHIRDVLGGQAQVFDESVLEPLRQVLGNEVRTPPTTTHSLPFSSPPLPPLPTAESPQPPSAPQLAASPPRAVKSPVLAPSSAVVAPSPPRPTSTSAAAPVPPPSVPPPPPEAAAAPSPSPSLLLGSRSEKPSTGLFRTPQPQSRHPINPLLGPPSTSLYPPATRPLPASAPPSTPAPPSQPPSNPAFPSAGFSTRPSSGAGRREASRDPLGAL